MPTVIDFHRPHKVAVLIVGGWKVTVRASARGRWRLELAGASGRHVWMFAAPTATLSAIVVEKLEAFLHDSATAWRLLPV